MTNLFINIRRAALILVFACSAVVLGIAASLADRLLPFDREYLIFALVVSGATIILKLALFQGSTPRTETILLFIFTILWLALAAYSVDRIGFVQCYQLTGDLETFRDKTMPAGLHCRLLKTIMGFSWGIFVMLLIMFIILITLTIRARSRTSHSDVWARDISEIPWFGQYVSSEGRHDYYPRYAISPGMMGNPSFGANGMGATYIPPSAGTPGTFYIPQPPGHSTQITRDAAGNVTGVQHNPVQPGYVA